MPMTIDLRRRRSVLAVVVIGFVTASCTTQTRPDAAPDIASASASSKDLHAALIDSRQLAEELHVTKIKLTPGPYQLSDMKAPLSSCTSPLRRSLQWATDATRLTMWDMSTYRHLPGQLDGVASFVVTFTEDPSDPLRAAASGLASCGTTSTPDTVTTSLGPTRVLRFRFGGPPPEIPGPPPPPSDAILLVLHSGHTVIGLLLGHPAATEPPVPSGGLFPEERQITERAITKAQDVLHTVTQY